jgi:hypothetical protein
MLIISPELFHKSIIRRYKMPFGPDMFDGGIILSEPRPHKIRSSHGRGPRHPRIAANEHPALVPGLLNILIEVFEVLSDVALLVVDDWVLY